jgi:hypothetical protein
MLTGCPRIHGPFLVLIAIAIGLGWAPRVALAEADPSPGAKVAELNRKALDDYDNLNFEEARGRLKAALILCDRNGLGDNPVRAQTYVNLGIVLLAADAQHREVAIAHFRRALQIQGDVRPAERVANPEVKQAFADAKAQLAVASEVVRPAGNRAAGGSAAADAAGEVREDGKAVDGARDARWFFAFGVGTGVGWASGTGEVNTDVKIPGGFQPSSAVHLAPELGYFVRPDLLLSLQGRFQMISGATPERDPRSTGCGADHVCSASTGASAVFVKASYFLGQGGFRPFLSGALGYGQIRHVVSLPDHNDCGADPAHPVACVDTALAGPIFLGPGVGAVLDLARHFALTLGASTLLGFSAFTFHVDVNAGVAVEL